MRATTKFDALHSMWAVPLTVPTHPLAVVPLKLWRPRWFDGVALVLGSIMPDIAYVADGYGVTIHSHAWHAPLWWSLPLCLVGARLIRWAAPVVAAHLPTPALRDYGVLGAVRHRWWVTAGSAVLGAISHIVWDAFTHPRVDGGRILFPWLHNQAPFGSPWWDLLSTVSDLLGLTAGLWLAAYVTRRRLVRAWYGPPPPMPSPRPAYFWATAGVVVALGVLLLPLQPVRFFHDQAVRMLLAAGLALLAASSVVRLR